RYDREQQRDYVLIRRENAWNEQSHSNSAIDDRHFPSPPQRDSSPDKVSRKPSRKEAAHIGGNEGNPNRGETALQFDSLCHQVNGEPLGNKEEHGICESFGDDRA